MELRLSCTNPLICSWQSVASFNITIPTKITWCHNCLISIMGIPIPGNRVGVNSIPELELRLNSNSRIGIGIGIEIGGIENGIVIENPGIGIGIGIEN